MASKRNDDLNILTVSGSVNLYDNQRCQATASEKYQASRISGHGWNILTNQEAGEVYFPHARNGDHFVDAKNSATSEWWPRRRRNMRPGSDDTYNLDSRQTIACFQSEKEPASKGWPALARKNRQLAQATFSNSFREYQTAMSGFPDDVSSAKVVPAPPLPFQKQLRDPQPAKLSARSRLMSKTLFTPRRFEEATLPTKGPTMSAPPTVRDMFSRSMDQVRSEAIDTLSPNFVDSVMKTDGSAVSAAIGHRTKHSSCRVDPFKVTEIAGWTNEDKVFRQDPYSAKPIQRTGNSCVKYDIISGRKKDFWY